MADESRIAKLQAQRTALIDAIATGALSVSHGDKSTTFRSINEMEQSIRRIEQELCAEGVAVPIRNRQVHAYTNRGI